MDEQAILEQAMENAMAFQQDGQLKEAVELYGAVLQIRPNHPDALHRLGWIAHQSGNHEMALDLISRAIEANPGEPLYCIDCGKVCLALGLRDAAIDCYRRGLELNPDHAEARRNLDALLKESHAHETAPSSIPSGKGIRRLSARQVQEAIQKGISFHQAGQLQQAESLYRQVLESDPENADALHLLGLVFRQRGDDIGAVELIGKAARIMPAVSFIHNNLGDALQSAGRVEEAIECYRRAIALDPKSAEAHMNLGAAYQELGKLDDAAACFRHALALVPDYAKAHSNLGRTLGEQGKFVEALTHLERAISLAPEYAEAHNNLGVLLHKIAGSDLASPFLFRALTHLKRSVDLKPSYAEAHNNLGIVCRKIGEIEEAIRCFEQAIACNPAHAQAFNNLGATLMDRGEYAEALSRLEWAVKIDPDYADAHNNLGYVLNELDSPCEAIAHFERALEIHPDDPSVYLNMGASYRVLANFEAAAANFEKAISLEPGYTEAFNNLALLYQENGKYDEAIKLYEHALERAPDRAVFHWNLALALLVSGDVERGWEKYEYRWKSTLKEHARPFTQSWWDGGALAGKTILLWGEQGIGDEILFASAIPEAMAAARHCVIECEPRLVALFARSFPQAEVIGRSQSPNPLTSRADIDLQSPFGNLQRWCRQRLSQGGFLHADPQRIAFWRDRIAGEGGGGLTVGIAWRSKAMTHLNKAYFTELAQWGAIFDVPGVTFVNLQYDNCRKELEQARQTFGVPILEWDDIDLMNDLDDAAALTAACDLVISAGTSVSAMAGALGVPTWRFMTPDDWISLGTNHVPWFPSMKPFRRKWGMAWDDVIEAAGSELRRLAGAAI